jgi:hypothetical protein
MQLYKYQIESIKNIYKKNNWEIQEFNLFNIRALENLRKDVFNDLSGFWTNEVGYLFQSTTDPGKKCINKKGPGNGALFLKSGFHPESLCIDLHNRRIKSAFCSRPTRRYSDGKWAGCKPQTIIRDSDADFDIKDNEKEYIGHFGANMHHASRWILKKIGLYGEGCRVLLIWDEMEFMLKAAKMTDMYRKTSKVTLFSEALFELGKYNEINNIYRGFEQWK